MTTRTRTKTRWWFICERCRKPFAGPPSPCEACEHAFVYCGLCLSEHQDFHEEDESLPIRAPLDKSFDVS